MQFCKKKYKSAVLLYGNSENNSNLFYLGNFFLSDNFLACLIDNKRKICFLNQLEYSRGIQESNFDKIYSLEKVLQEIKRLFYTNEFTLVNVIKYLIYIEDINELSVFEDFPVKIYNDLIKEKSIKINIIKQHLFFNRSKKNALEVKNITNVNKIIELAFSIVEKILKESKIKRKILYFNNKILTVEYLKFKIQIICLKKGAIAKNIILSCGNQTCEPHHQGNGYIYANELIIIDIFPRMIKTGYYGDMTRTFLKGEPSDEQIKLVQTVQKAHNLCINNLKENVSFKQIHKLAYSYFQSNKYITYKDEGFIHSIGHGIGLDIHESPFIKTKDFNLEKGNVLTIEPGLYYKGLGGCRIEDTLLINRNNALKLSNFHYSWVIK